MKSHLPHALSFSMGSFFSLASRTLGASILGLLASTCPGRADVRLPGLFTDNMVLQQGKTIPVWGWADEGEVVTVRFRGHTRSTLTQQGKWFLRLEATTAGGPDTLSVSGRNTLEIRNVLVGEVWVCSGQSNMEWPLSASFQPQNDITNSANPKIRLFTVPKLKSPAPVDDVKSTWVECSPDTVKSFSAVGYYFGRALQKARNVPVGLIHTSWGGSSAEAWMSEKALSSDPEYKRDILDPFPAAWQAYEKAKQEAESQGKQGPWPPWRPSELYNGMIAPILPFAMEGAIWYQGESNAGRAWQYRRLFPDMVRDWRTAWGQSNFTFLAVQLAPWDKNRKRTLEQITEKPVESDWAELREAQVMATRTLPKLGLVVITDVGDKDDIHPTKKIPVGERLAQAARVIAYGERIAGLSPIQKSLKIKDNEAVVGFEHLKTGLAAVGDKLTGFAIAGPDRKFVWADAKIRGDRVVVSSPAVPKPVAVRYGWDDFPVVNLWSKEGLPVSPFRTDDFPMVTAPKR